MALTCAISTCARSSRSLHTLHCAMLCVCVAIGSSCGRHSGSESNDSTSADGKTFTYGRYSVEQLTGTLVVSSPIIGLPRHLAFQRPYLWVHDRSGDPYLHVIDVRTGEIVLSFGQSGEGPGQFASISGLRIRPGDSTAIWAYDPELRRMTRLTPDVRHAVHVVTLASALQPYDLLWLRHDRLLGIDDLDTNRFRFIDTLGHAVGTRAGPLLGDNSISWPARRGLSNGFIACADPAIGRFAVLFVGAGRVDIHDTSGTLVAHADVPFRSNGEFRRDNSGRWQYGTTWRYYADCAATDRHLYALFAGVRMDTPAAARVIVARHVHVFDWSGRLDGVLELDEPVGTLAVDGDSVLYATGMVVPGVFRYVLPPSYRAVSATDRLPRALSAQGRGQ